MVSFLVIYIVYFEKVPTSQMHTFYFLVKLFDTKEDKVPQTTKTLTIIIIVLKLNSFFHYVNDVECPIF